MVKNQLFRVIPAITVINELLGTFGLSTLDDTNFFTKDIMNELNTVEQVNKLINTLSNYYLPCKSRIYLKHINNNKCITVLRQFIKIHNYTLISKERYINRKKLCVYRLIKLNDKPTKSKQNDIVISFE